MAEYIKREAAKAFTFTLDKDHDPAKHPDFRAFRATRELIERLVEAENAAFMNEIRANTVVVNGRKYGILKGHPGYIPTVFGMRLETSENMPDDWDFYLQQRPTVRPTNADVVPVVRCKDCKLGVRLVVDLDGHEVIVCCHGNISHMLDWFCADGAKMDGGENV